MKENMKLLKKPALLIQKRESKALSLMQVY